MVEEVRDDAGNCSTVGYDHKVAGINVAVCDLEDRVSGTLPDSVFVFQPINVGFSPTSPEGVLSWPFLFDFWAGESFPGPNPRSRSRASVCTSTPSASPITRAVSRARSRSDARMNGVASGLCANTFAASAACHRPMSSKGMSTCPCNRIAAL